VKQLSALPPVISAGIGKMLDCELAVRSVSRWEEARVSGMRVVHLAKKSSICRLGP